MEAWDWLYLIGLGLYALLIGVLIARSEGGN